MTLFETPIIPINQIYYHNQTNDIIDWKTNYKNSLDFQAIASFCALGFMLDDDTFYQNIKVIHPSTQVTLNDGKIIKRKKKWNWNYNPSNDSFNNVVEDFSSIFKKSIIEQTENKKILLPISGGLDSRTLLIPIKDKSKIIMSSYKFENGFDETYYGKEIASRLKIPIHTQNIPKGYIWNKIHKLDKITNCFSEFTHPRQLAAIDNWKSLGDVVLLGHMGDLLFESQCDNVDLSFERQLELLSNKIIEPGGTLLAEDLWSYWDLNGKFGSYINDRLYKLFSNIKIDHPSAKIRAFKSQYYVPRMTSVNLSFFEQIGNLILPYYQDEMCKFISRTPEVFLKSRKIQIEYIKTFSPELAQIPWQKFHPLNLYNYQNFNQPYYYLIRIFRKVKRLLSSYIFNTPNLVIRNWELQFLGTNNIYELEKILLKKSGANKYLPLKIVRNYLENFKKNPIKYAHSISMLLTITIFFNNHISE